jgi:hypothetical protein
VPGVALFFSHFGLLLLLVLSKGILMLLLAREDFAVATAVVSDSTGNIIGAATQKFFFTDGGM